MEQPPTPHVYKFAGGLTYIVGLGFVDLPSGLNRHDGNLCWQVKLKGGKRYYFPDLEYGNQPKYSLRAAFEFWLEHIPVPLRRGFKLNLKEQAYKKRLTGFVGISARPNGKFWVMGYPGYSNKVVVDTLEQALKLRGERFRDYLNRAYYDPIPLAEQLGIEIPEETDLPDDVYSVVHDHYAKVRKINRHYYYVKGLGVIELPRGLTSFKYRWEVFDGESRVCFPFSQYEGCPITSLKAAFAYWASRIDAPLRKGFNRVYTEHYDKETLHRTGHSGIAKKGNSFWVTGFNDEPIEVFDSLEEAIDYRNHSRFIYYQRSLFNVEALRIKLDVEVNYNFQYFIEPITIEN